MFSSSLLQAYSGASIWELMLRRRYTMLLGNHYMSLRSFLRTCIQQHIEFVTTVVSWHFANWHSCNLISLDCFILILFSVWSISAVF